MCTTARSLRGDASEREREERWAWNGIHAAVYISFHVCRNERIGVSALAFSIHFGPIRPIPNFRQYVTLFPASRYIRLFLLILHYKIFKKAQRKYKVYTILSRRLSSKASPRLCNLYLMTKLKVRDGWKQGAEHTFGWTDYRSCASKIAGLSHQLTRDANQ